MNSTTFKVVQALRARKDPVYAYILVREIGEAANDRIPQMAVRGVISRAKSSTSGQSQYFITDEQYANYMRGKKVAYLKKLTRMTGENPVMAEIISDYMVPA